MVLCLVLALIFLVMSVFLFMGKGAWLIAGFNTMTEEEKAEYDRKKVCRAVAVVCTVCTVLLCAMAYFLYRAEHGAAEGEMLAFTAVFLIAVLAAVVWAGVYVNKYAKK